LKRLGKKFKEVGKQALNLSINLEKINIYIYIYIYIYIFAFSVFFNSCDFDKILCGELDDKLKRRIENVEKSYGSILNVHPIPCEFNYIIITL
jgi:hypothetical protein